MDNSIKNGEVRPVKRTTLLCSLAEENKKFCGKICSYEWKNVYWCS